ncbi:Protein CBR-UNC-60 [Caenorhabditis briggsae]|uniref:Protein CBR-UNC-60 n=1 Tax=Caenorhabditis briggsae TaxID=6238 RepID=A8X2K2_CAEBR|nr:Protein CBR-UNC-60 [Caenorhabditis briggsae]CAP26862.2 Protein CBR-UNC-60 [Caenorhabditis briggsae]
MSSGVMVDPDVQTSFQKLSEGRKEYRYIIFKIEDNKVIVESAVTQDQLELTGDDYDDSSKAAFEKFAADIKSRTNGLTDCRYAVFDFKFTCSRVGAGTSKMDKIIFLQICPDGASIKKKMVYASSAAAIKASLGTGKILQFQASGVKVDPSCKNAYDLLHNKHQHSYIIFKIDKNDTAIVVEKVGDKNAPYSEFVEEMKKLVEDGKECRYAAVDVEVTVQRQGAEGASTLNKVIFVQYCPDNAPVRRRMLYASSVRALKASLGLESLFQVQASEMSDLDEKVVKSDLMSNQRI